MRFLRLDLKAFGPFEEVALDFDPDIGGMHFIYGANEAGKSSLSRAIQSLLFGIPVQTSDAFRHSMKKLRLGATLRHSNGTTISFWRRKARINTLFEADDEEPLPEDAIDRFLGGIDRDVFAAMFGLDQESLVRGGQDILQGKGQLGPMLFAAGSGIADARAVQDALRDEWEELFKATGRTQRISKRIAELNDARKQTQERELSLEVWSRHDATHGQALAERGELQHSVDEKRTQYQRLSRWRDALPLLARHAELISEDAADGNRALLPADFAERRRAAETKLRLAGQRLGDAEKRRADLERQLADAPPPSECLAKQDIIESLHRQLGDMQRLRRQRDAARAELSKLDASLAADSADAAERRWSDDDTRTLRSLGQRFGKLTADMEHRQRRLADLEKQLAGLEKPNASPQPAHDLAAIQRELSESSQPGPPPTESDLLEARRLRDEAIRSLPATPIAELSRLVSHADLLADRIRFAGKQAERRATLQQRGKELQRTIDQNKEAQRREASLREEFHKARDEAHAAQESLLDWRARWQPLMPRLGLDPQAEPGEAYAAVDAMQQRAERRRTAAALRETLANIERELQAFAEEARTLGEEGEPEAIVQAAYARLKQARLAADRAKTCRQQLEECGAVFASAKRDADLAAAELESLRQEAHAESLDALPSLEEASAKRRQRQYELARLEKQLDRLRDGAPLDGWRNDVQALRSDELDRQLAELAAAMEADGAKLQELDRAIGRTQGELARMDGAGAAAESAQKAEMLASQLCNETEQFLVLRLAHGLLQEAVDAWRQKSEDGIVRRASELYRQLTCGAFESLDIEPDDKGQPIVYGMRAGDRSKVHVEAMSDGSRDQLYLALRLASLEAWLQTHEPIPVIVDDLLLNFDDDRALAAMRALCELSKRTQVLFFTHHRHLIDLATRHLPTKRVFFHDLGPREPRSVAELF